MSGAVFAAFYRIVRRIPAGKVATYGQIARLAGMPRCARTVGYAMAGCTDPTVPCHRVVDRFGGTKACFDTFASGTQRALLEMEGVVFTMYDARTNLSLQVVENVKENLNQNIYKTIIPRNVRLAEAPSYGQPINIYDPRSSGAESYRLLAEEVINREDN